MSTRNSALDLDNLSHQPWPLLSPNALYFCLASSVRLLLLDIYKNWFNLIQSKVQICHTSNQLTIMLLER